MKYKLIKKYPGCVELGTIVERDSNCSNYYYRLINGISNTFTPKNIENHPEFWQEIVEKDYEILSLILQRSDKHQISDMCANSHNYKISLLNCHGNRIHSIKRLSDSEIFTIGDKIEFTINNKKSSILIINSIDLNDLNEIVIYTNKARTSLSHIHHIKQPLFTTEQRSEIEEIIKNIIK